MQTYYLNQADEHAHWQREQAAIGAAAAPQAMQRAQFNHALHENHK